MAYADNPNHESYMPSFQETTDKYNEYWNLLANTPGANVRSLKLPKLMADLQSIFDAASKNRNPDLPTGLAFIGQAGSPKRR
jgi:multiple sugar transport system substrate-binding protein